MILYFLYPEDVKESPAYQIVRVESISSFSDSGAAEKKNLTKDSRKRDVGFSYSMKGYISTRKKIKREVSFVYLFCRQSTCIFVLKDPF